MESDGGATSSRRSERSSSTQGVYMPSVGEEMDEVAPKCRCGVYVILYLSKTSSNPNRLFLGCPFYKTQGRIPYCRYFKWLDQYTTKVDKAAAAAKCGEGAEDVAEHFSIMEHEWRFSELEKRIACLEQRKKSIHMCYIMGLFLFLVGVYMATK
ncbi:hypothetical protein PIB30_008353 [Stylosanthes scabra]|uniref:GRF-type domain-containing protein n=1 Tax=Stylosanthes scabra TaxID=79078 RepID=A0ABU6T6R3_9FABA|nr:hypothetical protein [Stylosanthes scabra]